MATIKEMGDDNAKIDNFWSWFSSISGSLSNDFEQQEKLNQLDHWISSFGEITWELGPGFKEPNSLTISPNGNIDLLERTKDIIRKAPKVKGWEFNYAKPPKQWDLLFSIEDESGAVVEINGNNWEYVLLKFPDGTFDVILKPWGNMPLEEDLKYSAAWLLLEGILGEELLIKNIQNIELVSSFEKDIISKRSSIKMIRQHLLDLKA